MGTTLVTGATGFIGSHLAEALASRGDQVRCLVRKKSDKTKRLESLDAELIQGDLNSPLEAAVKDCETVYHVAGLRCALSNDELYDVNDRGTRRLAEACCRSVNPPKFILVSSVAAAGPTQRDHRRTEDETPRPVSYYGKSKLAGEQALREFADQLPATIVRPGIVFGAENAELLPVFQMIRRYRFHLRAGLTTPRVSLIHVADLVELLLKAEAHDETLVPLGRNGTDRRQLGQGVYNACDEVCPDWKQFGEMIGASMDRKLVVHFPLFVSVAAIGAAFSQAFQKLTRRPDVFNLDKIREARQESWAFSTQKIFQTLSFEPAQPLQQRLNETAQWYVDHEWLK